MRHLDLCSGIGGFALAARRVSWTTVQFVEIDTFCQRVLAKNFPGVPIHDDLKTYTGATGSADVVSAGYPCQPFSTAGERRGEADDRHLWPEVYRVISETRPRWFVGENVAGHISLGLDSVLADLEGLGYASETFVIPACATDARHRRDRVWIVSADTECPGLSQRELFGRVSRPGELGVAQQVAVVDRESPARKALADTERERPQGPGQPVEPGYSGANQGPQAGRFILDGFYRDWQPEPGVARVANGLPDQVDRIKALGNAIVPAVAVILFAAINELSSGAPSG